MTKRSLGKGLSILLREEVSPIIKNEIVNIVEIDKIEAGKYQPRKVFEDDKLRELTESILNNGLLQPILVSTLDSGKYKIIAGERRWRACLQAGYKEIPVIIKDLTNKETLEIALVENIQRQELSSIEEAEGYERLINEFEYTQEKLAESIGKSRSHIANLLRLNNLPESIKDKIKTGQLSMGHARCLIGSKDSEDIAQYVIENDLNVRQTESLVKNWKKTEKSLVESHKSKERVNNVKADSSDKVDNLDADNDLKILAESLSEKFGAKITIEGREESGKIIFHYEGMAELDLILSKL